MESAKSCVNCFLLIIAAGRDWHLLYPTYTYLVCFQAIICQSFKCLLNGNKDEQGVIQGWAACSFICLYDLISNLPAG